MPHTPYLRGCAKLAKQPLPHLAVTKSGIEMKVKLFAAGIAAALMVSACTSSEKVSVMQPGDEKMSCAELENEFERLETVKRDAERDGGVNTANVAAVVFFWPAAVGNWINAEEAQELVEDRRQHLMGIYSDKNC